MKNPDMDETYYTGSYWLGREESAEACAQRTETFFRYLASCDPTFTRWFEQADSRAEALRLQIEPDATTFLKMFNKKANQTAKGGFLIRVWNGESSGQASVITLSCGSSSHRIPNACTLEPPLEGSVAERINSAPVLTQVLHGMALAWNPEFGIATSHTHRDEVLNAGRAGTFVGWVMYFSRRRGTVPPLPSPVRTESVENQGTLVILTPERFTARNPEHVALAANVQDLLSQAGLLGPLQPWKTPSPA